MGTPLESLDTGDILLFDRRCLAMMHPLSTLICGAAKMDSRFDHVGIVYKVNSTDALPEVISSAISQPAEGGVYVLEANLNGVTLRPLDQRIRRSSSNAIAVRTLKGVVRDSPFRQRFDQEVTSLLGSRYRDSVGELVMLAVETPDESERRDTARLLLQLRAQIDGIRSLRGPDGALLHENSTLHAVEEECIARYNSIAEKSRADAIPESGGRVVCSEVVARCLQAVSVLSSFPSASMYLPRDFDERRSLRRLVFASPTAGLSETLYLSGHGPVHAEGPTPGGWDAAVSPVLPPQRSGPNAPMEKALLRIGHVYLVATLLTMPLVAMQTRLQLRSATFVRGSALTFVGAQALRIATASSLHVMLSEAFAGDIRSHFTSSLVDLGHPFYDVVLRGGVLGVLAALLTAPLEILNLRFHFFGYKRWYSLPVRSLMASAGFGVLAASSYCGPLCWPMFYESVVPCFFPLAPSMLRGHSMVHNAQEDVEAHRNRGLALAMGLCVAHQAAVYPLETMRLRYAMDKNPIWRNPFLGFRKFGMRVLPTIGITYLGLRSGLSE